MEARLCAICSLESVDSVVGDGSGVAREDRAAFSVATIERGRLCGRSEACEFGRRCQERGDRGGIAFVGLTFMPELRFSSVSDVLRPLSNGIKFSLVGDNELPVSLSIASSKANSRGGSDVSAGGAVFSMSASASEILVGVDTGDDFVGDIDLARSEFLSWSNLRNLHKAEGDSQSNWDHTSSTGFTLLSPLQNFVFELSAALLGLLVPLFAHGFDFL